MENNKKQNPVWTYYLLDISDIYVKTISNTSKAGNHYNVYYFYKAEKNGTVIFKFSTPVWNCFPIWDGKDRYLILKVDKSDTNASIITMVQQLESMRAMEYVKKFDAGYVFAELGDDTDID